MSASTELEDKHHDPTAAIAAFDALSDSELAKIGKIAKVFAGNGNLASPEELISESYVRIAKGTRRWPRSEAFMVFLGGTVKSLASDKMFATDAKKGRKLALPLFAVSEEQMPNIADSRDTDSASSKRLQEELITGLELHFQKDEEMQLFIMGLMDGLRGQELEKIVGVDTKRLEALRTRYNRQVVKIATEIRVREGLSS